MAQEGITEITIQGSMEGCSLQIKIDLSVTREAHRSTLVEVLDRAHMGLSEV